MTIFDPICITNRNQDRQNLGRQSFKISKTSSEAFFYLTTLHGGVPAAGIWSEEMLEKKIGSNLVKKAPE